MEKKRKEAELIYVLCYGYIFMLYFLLSDDFFFFKLICFLLELLEGKKIQGVNSWLGLFFSCLVPIMTLVQRTYGWWIDWV